MARFWIQRNGIYFTGPFGPLMEANGDTLREEVPEGGREISDEEKALCDARTSLDKDMLVDDSGSLRLATVEEKAAGAPTLLDALTTLFDQVTDPQIIARFWPMRVAVKSMLLSEAPLAAVAAYIDAADLSGLSSEIQAIRLQMLSLPQWEWEES